MKLLIIVTPYEILIGIRAAQEGSIYNLTEMLCIPDGPILFAILLVEFDVEFDELRRNFEQTSQKGIPS